MLFLPIYQLRKLDHQAGAADQRSGKKRRFKPNALCGRSTRAQFFYLED
jgi:hypothetical protein